MANNAVFNALNGSQQNTNNGFSNFMSEFQRLQQTVKNPRAEVERLLQTGQMSQSQFNQFSQIAQQIVGSGAFK